MKNLVAQLVKENKSEFLKFKKGLSELKSVEDFKKFWYYNRFLTPAMLKKGLTITELKKLVLAKYLKESAKGLTLKLNRLQVTSEAPELVSIKIVVEWAKSKTWGANPTAEAWFLYRGANGNESEYIKTRSVTGCGYDKLSTAVAEALNQSNAVLKLLYTEKNRAKNKGLKNHEIFGYGSGYGILPSIEGGVGVSCYPDIFKKVGFEFKTIAEGKNFDAFTIEKIKK